jgi:predicted  nucleic acid-binding Zn-ribbon protein
MIDENLIISRKEILTTEIQNLQDRLTDLEKEKSALIGNINAMRGALQQCDYFAGVLEEEIENAAKKAKKDKSAKVTPDVSVASTLTEGGLKR